MLQSTFEKLFSFFNKSDKSEKFPSERKKINFESENQNFKKVDQQKKLGKNEDIIKDQKNINNEKLSMYKMYRKFQIDSNNDFDSYNNQIKVNGNKKNDDLNINSLSNSKYSMKIEKKSKFIEEKKVLNKERTKKNGEKILNHLHSQFLNFTPSEKQNFLRLKNKFNQSKMLHKNKMFSINLNKLKKKSKNASTQTPNYDKIDDLFNFKKVKNNFDSENAVNFKKKKKSKGFFWGEFFYDVDHYINNPIKEETSFLTGYLGSVSKPDLKKQLENFVDSDTDLNNQNNLLSFNKFSINKNKLLPQKVNFDSLFSDEKNNQETNNLLKLNESSLNMPIEKKEIDQDKLSQQSQIILNSADSNSNLNNEQLKSHDSQFDLVDQKDDNDIKKLNFEINNKNDLFNPIFSKSNFENEKKVTNNISENSKPKSFSFNSNVLTNFSQLTNQNSQNDDKKDINKIILGPRNDVSFTNTIKSGSIESNSIFDSIKSTETKVTDNVSLFSNDEKKSISLFSFNEHNNNKNSNNNNFNYNLEKKNNPNDVDSNINKIVSNKTNMFDNLKKEIGAPKQYEKKAFMFNNTIFDKNDTTSKSFKDIENFENKPLVLSFKNNNSADLVDKNQNSDLNAKKNLILDSNTSQTESNKFPVFEQKKSLDLSNINSTNNMNSASISTTFNGFKSDKSQNLNTIDPIENVEKIEKKEVENLNSFNNNFVLTNNEINNVLFDKSSTEKPFLSNDGLNLNFQSKKIDSNLDKNENSNLNFSNSNGLIEKDNFNIFKIKNNESKYLNEITEQNHKNILVPKTQFEQKTIINTTPKFNFSTNKIDDKTKPLQLDTTSLFSKTQENKNFSFQFKRDSTPKIDFSKTSNAFTNLNKNQMFLNFKPNINDIKNTSALFPETFQNQKCDLTLNFNDKSNVTNAKNQSFKFPMNFDSINKTSEVPGVFSRNKDSAPSSNTDSSKLIFNFGSDINSVSPSQIFNSNNENSNFEPVFKFTGVSNNFNMNNQANTLSKISNISSNQSFNQNNNSLFSFNQMPSVSNFTNSQPKPNSINIVNGRRIASMRQRRR